MAPTLFEHGAKPGDLIQIFRGTYQHWAVYIGGNEVVHLTTPGGDSSSLGNMSLALNTSVAQVMRHKIWEVVCNDRFQINNLLDDKSKHIPLSFPCKFRFQLSAAINRLQVSETARCYLVVSVNLEHGAKPGDLIQIFRGSFEHWAVYIGGDEVVHLTTSGGYSSSSGSMSLVLDSGGDQVMRGNIWEVIDDDPFQINNLLDDKYEPRERHVIVREACGMVGSVLKYSVVSLNCEHFATELRYGRPESRQVKNAVIGGAAVIVGVGLAVGAIALLTGPLKNDAEEKEEEEDAREKKHKKHQKRQRHQNWQ
ncbi:uncharacterized protein LOC130201713 [Pseudoliparis swirei]|uniref:uncharacterized protein LOC130201713 n=1 Tax=Pseudoliparis swirei TaxID=2059687 RepID=UPI0024BDFE9F|nr:uncharacterized protein LOC130201713 [Pseudoliparis swirei]